MRGGRNTLPHPHTPHAYTNSNHLPRHDNGRPHDYNHHHAHHPHHRTHHQHHHARVEHDANASPTASRQLGPAPGAGGLAHLTTSGAEQWPSSHAIAASLPYAAGPETIGGRRAFGASPVDGASGEELMRGSEEPRGSEGAAVAAAGGGGAACALVAGPDDDDDDDDDGVNGGDAAEGEGHVAPQEVGLSNLTLPSPCLKSIPASTLVHPAPAVLPSTAVRPWFNILPIQPPTNHRAASPPQPPPPIPPPCLGPFLRTPSGLPAALWSRL